MFVGHDSSLHGIEVKVIRQGQYPARSRTVFLPHDAMLERYILSSCVHHKSVFYKEVEILGSRKQCHTIAHGHWFSGAKNLGEIPMGSPANEAPNTGRVSE